MTAIVGTVEVGSSAHRLADTVRVASARLVRSSEPVEQRTGRNWFAAAPLRGENGDSWFTAEDFAVVHGSPRVVGDAAFAAEASDRGVAAACASAYERAGPKFLARLEGPFALAIRLERQDRTVLAIDRLGVFSIYYAATVDSLAFSSKLGRLLAIPGIDNEIDPQAIYDYLFFHVIPGPATAFSHVRRLPPAGFFERVQGRDAIDRYWQVRFENEKGRIDFSAARHEFLHVLESGVRAELSATKRIGCFLSGGTDSSTLAGMVTRVGGEPARTYSIGFEQRGFDEIEYARIASRHFGTRHKEHYVDARDIVRILPRLAEIYGQPFGNSSVVPTFCCAEMAAGDGVETMMGGDGGDELFGGNQRYATQQLFSYYLDVPERLRRYVLEPFAFKVPGARSLMPLRKLGRYIEQALVPMPDRLQTYNHLNLMDRAAMLEPEFLTRLDQSEPERSAAVEYQRTNAETLLNKMLALDWKYTLADNDLPKVVEMCDAAGVMASFPFLRREMFDFAARLPAPQKVNRFRLRYFFKKALADFLPVEIIRKKKHGFGMPFGDWLVAPGPLRDLTFDNLGAFKGRGLVRPSFVDNLCNTYLAQHPNYYGGLIWLLLVLEFWLQWHDGLPRGLESGGIITGAINGR